MVHTLSRCRAPCSCTQYARALVPPDAQLPRRVALPVVHTRIWRIGDGMIKEAHTEKVTRLQRLLRAWIDAEPSRNPRDLARAAGLPPSTVYKLLKPLKERPSDQSFRGLASVPGLAPESVLRYAVALDMELIPPEADLGDPETRALVRQLLQDDPTGP